MKELSRLPLDKQKEHDEEVVKLKVAILEKQRAALAEHEDSLKILKAEYLQRRNAAYHLKKRG